MALEPVCMQRQQLGLTDCCLCAAAETRATCRWCEPSDSYSAAPTELRKLT